MHGIPRICPNLMHIQISEDQIKLDQLYTYYI
jgi:hypothetical protein